ncbi:MAG: GxxExxY protein [Caldilineaceae bacterium]|nr:GxxExxY protein [Caldilineaceae bacterium]
MSDMHHRELTYYLRGLGFRIHNALKGGHEESVYEQALAWSLARDKTPFLRQSQHRIDYKGKQVGEYYTDFMLADGKVLVECKAAPEITPQHKAQVLSYMAVTKAELGFIMNFGAPSLQTERLPNFLDRRKPLEWQTATPVDQLFPKLTNQVLKSLYTVHHELGPGFLSQVYRRATRIELANQRLNFIYLKELPLFYEGHQLTTVSSRLFLLEEKILLATFAATGMTHQYTDKMYWAMQVTNVPLGILANFYPSRLDVHFVRARQPPASGAPDG